MILYLHYELLFLVIQMIFLEKEVEHYDNAY